MLNGIQDSTDGSRMSIEHEPGNSLCFDLGSYELKGRITGNEEEFIFSSNGDRSAIGIVKDCAYSEYINVPADCLPLGLVQGEFRVKNGCERILYFYDGINPDRRINLDRLERYWTADYREWEFGDKEEPFVGEQYDCNLMRLNPIINKPCVKGRVKSESGNLLVGNYFPIIEILDSQENVVFRSDEGLYITVGSGDVELKGAFNLENTDAEIGGIPEVSKTIELTVENLDVNFSFIRVNFIRYVTGDGVTRDAIRVGELYPIDNETMKVKFNGFNASAGDTFIDPSELVVPNVVYETSSAMEQVQNRLVRGNLKEPSYDFGEWQKAASKIDVTWKSNLVPHVKGQIETMPADEIVPLAIEFCMSNGTVSPPFHIPGRCPNKSTYKIGEGDDCLIVEFIVIGRHTQDIEYTVTYKKDGVEKAVTGVYDLVLDDKVEDPYISDFKDERVIDCGNITDVQLTSNSKDFLNGKVIVRVKMTGQDYDNQVVPTEFDTYVSPIWTKEMEHLISEDQYKRIAGDLYGTTDAEELQELKELPLPKRFEIFNTAYKTSTNEGELGYHQTTNTKYQKPSNYCGNDFWGVDSCGNSLENTPIRHHRIPCRKLLPVQGLQGFVRQIGLKFDNIEYPHPDIIGHRILMGKRTEDTVLDNGISGYLQEDVIEDLDTVAMSYLASTKSTDKSYFISPKVLIDNAFLGGDYVKLNYTQNLKTGFFYTPFDNISDDFKIDRGSGGPEKDYRAIWRHWKPGILDFPQEQSEVNFNIEKDFNIPPGSLFNDTTEYVNISTANNIKFLDLNRELPLNNTGVGNQPNSLEAEIAFTTVKRATQDVYTNLGAVQYRQLNPCRGENEDIYYNGGNFINNFEFVNHLFTGINSGFLKILIYALAIAAGAASGGLALGLTSAVLTIAGVAFAASLGFGAIFQALSNGRYDDFILDLDNYGSKNEGGGANGQSHFFFEFLNNIYIESSYRYDMLASSTDDCGQRFDFDYLENESALISYVERKVSYYNEQDEELVIKPIPCPELYLYNKDFSRVNYDSIRFGLDTNYDFCKKCAGEYPNRVVYSEKSFDEERQDTYAVTLANNYVDLPAHRGDITGIKYKDGALLIHCENTTFVKRPNPQSLQTDAGTVYVGIGDFLALPEKEINETTSGFAGMQTRLANVNTPYGYFWADERKGFVHTTGGKNGEIAGLGLAQWFKENLPSKLTKSFGEINNEYIGVTMGYDPRFRRLLVTKRDYKPLSKNIKYDGVRFILEEKDTSKEIQLTDANYFANCSWTLSYSFLDQAWISWHSYTPTFYYNNSSHYFTDNRTSVWRHNHIGNYLNYYGKKQDFIIEWGVPTMYTADLHAVHYVDYPKIWDEINEKWVPVPQATFDRLWIYNSCQSTGIQPIEYIDQQSNPFGNVNWGNPTVILNDNAYKISRIHDYALRNPVLTSDWNILKDYDGYIDCLPINIGDKSQYDLNYLKDKYAFIRLFSKPDEDVKQSIHFVNSEAFISIS